jgi:hypothetical protein
MGMEWWLAGENQSNLVGHLPQYHLVHHKFHMQSTRTECETQRWEVNV